MGWPGRMVRIQGPGGAHVVSEVFSREFGKWILTDGQHDVHVSEDGVPLSILEFQQAVVAGQTGKIVPAPPNESFDYVAWTSGYLRYLMYPADVSYGRQMTKILVLADKDDPGPQSKPGYLSDTEYELIRDSGIVYPRIKPPAVGVAKPEAARP